MKILLCAFVLAASMAFAESEGAKVLKIGLATDDIKMWVDLPDAENGYYRGTRFDWSGMIARVRVVIFCSIRSGSIL